ncbi:MAG: PfkB family carbohydrate kinase [Candidatus Flexifilum sp.]
MTGPHFVTIGSIFIDDLVFPDGRTQMAVLGGGATHAAAGMRVWDERAGIIACIGRDLPEGIYARLARDFDLRGIVRLDLPQARAWQIFEWDGTRTEVFRMKIMAPFIDEPTPQACPADYAGARGVHVLRDAAGFLSWRRRFPQAVVLWEPNQPYMAAEHRDEFVAALAQADIVSPNLLETRLLYAAPDAAPLDLVRRMLDDGARLVALRLGEDGSLIGRRTGAGDQILHVPAVPVPQIVDVTGAGNCYCGAFLVGWVRADDLRLAGAYGAVAASFTVEQVGALDNARVDSAERDRRLRFALDRITEVT